MKNSGTLVRKQLEWLDLIKAFAITWILITHIGEKIFGAPYIANPSAEWPSFSLRVAQLAPLKDYGFFTIFVNLFRYISWTGDHGVQLFLIASGFGLAWSLLTQDTASRIQLGSFYAKRLLRIYPLWLGVHILYAIATFIAGWEGWGLHPGDPKFFLSFIGFRITPELFYYFSPAWWFFGLLLQLYLVFPFLWWLLKKAGPAKLLLTSTFVALSIRGIGLFIFTDYLDAWSRGAIFITRLPEFVVGICLASWFYNDQQGVIRFMKKPPILILSLCSILIGLILSLTLFGMIFAYFLIGAGVFIILFALFVRHSSYHLKIRESGVWLGKHSYSIYLVHHPLILLFISANSGIVSVLLAVLFTLMITVGLERSVDLSLKSLSNWYKKYGLFRMLLHIVIIPIVIFLLLLAGELAMQRVNPMEVLGWGERPSLTPDPVLGYRMKPLQVTQLRWESYDYVVSSNSLGFPGPEYFTNRNSNTFRVMTVGDAFTSAEGVNTESAWPRLLEKELTILMPNKKVEVLNFGVTGYGPNQYLSIVEQYAPIYTPDIIIIGFFVNDYQDVMVSNEEFQQSIGFGLPLSSSWYATSRLMHLRHYLDKRILETITHMIKGDVDYYGYFLGNFASLERSRVDSEVKNRQLVFKRLEKIKDTANQVGADVYILMIPAPVQVCDSDDLDYFPRGVDLSDPEKFDIDLPQRMTKELADALNIEYIDLRNQLKSLQKCPYQPRNMHWTLDGHQAVADYLSDILHENVSVP